MKKQLLSIFSVILFGFSLVQAQNAPTPVKQISMGVLNGKATSLPRPAYPAAARAVKAEGSVQVKITVDEEGNVISAEAVSGHPLLQQASVQAAQQAKFSPTALNGQSVKFTGVIVYNFIAPEITTNWTKMGYDLNGVQNGPLLVFLDTNSIEKVFKSDWTTEREQLKRLGEIKQAEIAKIAAQNASSEKTIGETTEKRPDGTVVKKVIREIDVKPDGEPDSEQVAISQSLIASLQSRLGGDELNLWRFNTGVSLNQALSKQRFTNDRDRVLGALRNQIQSAPSEISPEMVADLQKLLTILENPKPGVEERNQIGMLLSKIFRN